MDKQPELYGQNGWSMIYRDGNFTQQWNGPLLCRALFGGLAEAITAFARQFV